jgi:hypothetical protein
VGIRCRCRPVVRGWETGAWCGTSCRTYGWSEGFLCIQSEDPIASVVIDGGVLEHFGPASNWKQSPGRSRPKSELTRALLGFRPSCGYPSRYRMRRIASGPSGSPMDGSSQMRYEPPPYRVAAGVLNAAERERAIGRHLSHCSPQRLTNSSPTSSTDHVQCVSRDRLDAHAHSHHRRLIPWHRFGTVADAQSQEATL